EELELLSKILDRRLEVVVASEVTAEAPVLVVELQHCLRVRDCRLDLAAAADDALVAEQLVDGAGRHPRDALRIEVVKRPADASPLVRPGRSKTPPPRMRSG